MDRVFQWKINESNTRRRTNGDLNRPAQKLIDNNKIDAKM